MINQISNNTISKNILAKPYGKYAIVNGYASLFNRLDYSNDVIRPGAFTKSLINKKPYDIKMLYYHDPKQPIGIWNTILQNNKGLLVSGQILNTTSIGKDIIEYIKMGAIDGLSIGFRTVKSRRVPRQNIREIVELDLWEISIVTFPMMPEARISKLDTNTNNIS